MCLFVFILLVFVLYVNHGCSFGMFRLVLVEIVLKLSAFL